jgi:LPS export ABC transporter protein LptC
VGRPLALALVIGLPLASLLGCTRKATPPQKPQPFVFRSLNLRQQDGKGRPAWELTSPMARYDLQRRVATASDPRGVVYAGGKPRYKVEATSGLVINDGQVIQLEGKVRILVLGTRPSVISGDRVRWTPSRHLMEIDRRPLLTESSSRLSATTARFLLDKDKLELRGPTRLLQPELDLRVAQADWLASTGALNAKGPVKGVRRPKGEKATVQTVTGSALVGNTRDEVVDLLAPVRFVDPSRKAVLDAQRTHWNVKEQILSTALPFTGSVDQMHVAGDSLQLLIRQKTAIIPTGCRLRQPGERLRARECRWDWGTQGIAAFGDVQLERDQNQQITRSQQLNGKLGSKGLAEFSTPGGRVRSELRVPPPAEGSRKPAPVTF